MFSHVILGLLDASAQWVVEIVLHQGKGSRGRKGFKRVDVVIGVCHVVLGDRYTRARSSSSQNRKDVPGHREEGEGGTESNLSWWYTAGFLRPNLGYEHITLRGRYRAILWSGG